MKTLYMETTKKTPEQTSSEIQQLLKNYGHTWFMFDYYQSRKNNFTIEGVEKK